MILKKSLKSERYIAFKPFPNVASQAEIIARKHDEPNVSDWTFRRPILNRLPDRYSIPVAHRYNDFFAKSGRRCANLYLLDIKDDLTPLALKLSANYDDLVNHAKRVAEICGYQRLRYPNEKKALKYLTEYVRIRFSVDISKVIKMDHLKDQFPVTVTDGNRNGKSTNGISCNGTVTVTGNIRLRSNLTLTINGMLNRLCDELWWRRLFNTLTMRNVEQYAIDLGLVHSDAGIYISDESMQRREQQIRRNKRKLESCTLVNEQGQEYNLQDLAEKSLANPSNRRNELMVRIRGTEEISKELGHIAMFYTVTCPSRMHARRFKSKSANPKYDGTSPREAQKYMSTMWSRVRAKLARMGIRYYGIRATEPHHDGTPHWHFLLFTEPQNELALTSVMRDYALKEDGDENGATSNRFDFEKIDTKIGSATGYISKYISKGIDGFGIEEDTYGKDAATSAQRISAWKNVWGVRQFQMIGGPPVTVYRELRRIEGQALQGKLLETWEAADTANYQGFIKLMGGPNTKRKKCPIQIDRVWSDEPNRYKEAKGYSIIGLTYGNVNIPTRIHQWSVTYHSSSKNNNFSIRDTVKPIIGPPLAPLDWYFDSFEKIRAQAS